MRRFAAVIAIACGVVLVSMPLAYAMFERTGEAERILDRFTFLTLGDNPERYLAEAETTRDGSSELVEEAMPTLGAEAAVVGIDLTTRYPALAAAQVEVPEATEFSVRYSQQLDAVKDKFRSVYDVPVAELSLTATPWLFVLGGLACVLAGSFALRASSAQPVVAILALGVAFVLGPVAFGAAQKASDGEDVKDFAEKGLTETAAAAAQDASASLDAVVAETQQRLLPDIAAAAAGSEAELADELEARFPAAAQLLEEWTVIGPRLALLADAVSASVAEFESAKELPIAFPVWVLLGLGALLGLAAGLALLGGRSSEPPDGAGYAASASGGSVT